MDALLEPKTLTLIALYFVVIAFIFCLNARDKKMTGVNVSDKPVTSVQTENYSSESIEVEKVSYYNIDLPVELQDIVFEECSKYDVDPELVLAIMFVESHYDKNAKNGPCLGLMQLDSTYFKKIYTPESNIKTGIKLLSDLYANPACENQTSRVILAYNNGVSGLKKLDKQGIVSTRYLTRVLTAINNISNRKAVEACREN